MSTEPTPPSAPKPQLPPAASKPEFPSAGTKPSLPQAPKLGLAGSKPTFKSEAAPAAPAAPSSGDPFATDTVAKPVTPPTIQRPPSIGAASTAPSATRAPFAGTSAAPLSQAQLVPVVEDAPKWAGAVAALGFVASIAAVALLFLELKVTL